jgi:hypothetical protein
MSVYVLIAAQLEGNDEEELGIFAGTLATNGWIQSETVSPAFTKHFSSDAEKAVAAARKELQSAAEEADVHVPYVLSISHDEPVTGAASSE